MLRTILAGAIAGLAPSGAAQARAIIVVVGSAQTFRVNGTPPAPGRPRRAPIGAAMPGPGDITVGLAPAGNAVGVAKLHVYERTRMPIAFTATAMAGGKTLATQTVCGRLEMDAWVTFPAGTEAVRVSDIAVAKPGCGQ